MSLFRFGRVVIRSFYRSLEVLREVPFNKARQVPLQTSHTKAVVQYGQHHALLPASNSTKSRLLPSSLTRAAYQGFIHGRSNLITNYGSIFKGQAIFRFLRKGEVQGPLFAFLGFVCSDFTVKTSQSREEKDFQRLYQWMQQGLKSSQKEDNVSNQDHQNLKLADYEIAEKLGKPSCNSAVYGAIRNDKKLAVKILFNFYSSRTSDLTREFSKEQEVLTVCAKEDEDDFRYTQATPHFNILPVLHSFVDSMPCLPDARDLYPAALPTRHDPSGSGRNRTMFIVMPKMDLTVEEYLACHSLDTKTSTLLLLQLLNGITHLNSLGIAHRDLKTDNLLLDTSNLGCPTLLICDFGCCLAEKRFGLHLPFLTEETERGGNLALMAPEVITAKPGDGVVIDYSKADAWAAGAIAYELFGASNPFICSYGGLHSSSYKDTDLPHLANVPGTVRWVIANLLRRNEHDRISARQAATILHVFLFAPDWWLRDQDLVTQGVILRWLLGNTTKMLTGNARRRKELSRLNYMLQLTFLSRASLEEVVNAVAVIRAVRQLTPINFCTKPP